MTNVEVKEGLHCTTSFTIILVCACNLLWSQPIWTDRSLVPQFRASTASQSTRALKRACSPAGDETSSGGNNRRWTVGLRKRLQPPADDPMVDVPSVFAADEKKSFSRLFSTNMV